MNFLPHLELKGLHSYLSPSQHYWVNYDDEKFDRVYENYQAREFGTRLHAFACDAINLGIKLPRNHKTLNMYVNDAIGFQMTPEQPLFYSENCFGTADAIKFDKNFLRIHDLKTGVTPASMVQLELYMSIFCLEYKQDPQKIKAELRIYQSGEIKIEEPDPDYIEGLMEKIVHFDQRIEELKMR